MLKLELFKSAPKSQILLKCTESLQSTFWWKSSVTVAWPYAFRAEFARKCIITSLVFLTTLNLAMSGDICICSLLESIICVSHVSDKGKGKAHNALQKKIKLILNIFLLHIVLDCFMTEVYSTMQFFKPSSHTFLQVQVSHLQFPGHTNLFLRQAFTEKLVLMYF